MPYASLWCCSARFDEERQCETFKIINYKAKFLKKKNFTEKIAINLVVQNKLCSSLFFKFVQPQQPVEASAVTPLRQEKQSLFFLPENFTIQSYDKMSIWESYNNFPSDIACKVHKIKCDICRGF